MTEDGKEKFCLNDGRSGHKNFEQIIFDFFESESFIVVFFFSPKQLLKKFKSNLNILRKKKKPGIKNKNNFVFKDPFFIKKI